MHEPLKQGVGLHVEVEVLHILGVDLGRYPRGTGRHLGGTVS